MFFTDSGRKLPWFLALFFHHTPYLCQLINETKTESPAESESYLIFSVNYLSPAELPLKKYISVGAKSLVTHCTSTTTKLVSYQNSSIGTVSIYFPVKHI